MKIILIITWSFCLFVSIAFSQEQAGGGSGASTAGVFKPIKDELSRPITAGGFIDNAPTYFADVTSKSGLDKFHHVSGNIDKRYILESPSGGVALFDYDNDGWLDIYLINGSTFAALEGKEKSPSAALFHNNKDGTFTDVTAKAGVENNRWGFGATCADFDNDGFTDIYVTNFGRNRLYRNKGNGTFIDVAERINVAIGGWSTGATFGDYDADGDLDLFVVGYVDFDLKNKPEPHTTKDGKKYCYFRGEPVMCGPRGLNGGRDYLLRNDGDKFTDVSKQAGVSDDAGYYGFAASFCDIDDDGRLDIVVANDSVPNYLYRNKGDGTFEDISYTSGVALNEDGREQAGMGLAVGDYNNDARLDLYITNFSDDSNTLYRNDGSSLFTDVTFAAGHGTTTIPFLGWGTGFIDFDNDGLKDVFVANGHVYPQVDKFDWGTTWGQRPLLFRNRNGNIFDLLLAASKSGLATVKSARGAAFGDINNDGFIDVVLNNCGDTPTLLLNVTKSAGNWISLKLLNEKGAYAVGASVRLFAGGGIQRVDVSSGSSYCSQNDMRLHFGLGGGRKIDKLQIRWPDGVIEAFSIPSSSINSEIVLTQRSK